MKILSNFFKQPASPHRGIGMYVEPFQTSGEEQKLVEGWGETRYFVEMGEETTQTIPKILSNRGSEWGGPLVAYWLKFSYFVGSWLKMYVYY